MGLSGMTVVAMTYIGEMFPSRVRGAFQARILMFGLIGIPATAYVARFAVPHAGWGWRLVFVWGALALFFPLVARRLEESPRWLERRGRDEEAETILIRIEAESPRAVESSVAKGVSLETSPINRDGGSIGIKGLIKSGAGGRALLLIGVWFCQTLGFYGF